MTEIAQRRPYVFFFFTAQAPQCTLSHSHLLTVLMMLVRLTFLVIIEIRVSLGGFGSAGGGHNSGFWGFIGGFYLHGFGAV